MLAYFIGFAALGAALFVYSLQLNEAKVREAKERYGPETEQVCPGDYMWKQDSEDNKCIINGVMIVRNAQLKDIRDSVDKVLSDPWYRRLLCKLMIFRNLPFWVKDKEFKIQNHCYKAELCAERRPTNDDELNEWISRAIVEDLPIDRPLWKIVVLEDYKKCDDGSGDFLSCVLLRCHHVIADGVALVSLLDTLMVDESEVKTGISAHNGIRKASVVNKQEPESIYKTYLRIAKYTIPVMGKILSSAIDVNPFKTRHISGRKVVGMLNNTIDLDRVKAVRTAMSEGSDEKYTVNDVLMGVLGTALNRTWTKIKPGHDVSELKVAMPVNMRTGTGRPKMENTFAPPIFNIPTNSADPLVSCQTMKKVMDDLKSKPVPHVFFTSLRLLAFYAPSSVSKYLLDDLASKTSAVVSNVPGPVENKYFVDKKLERIAMWSPQRGTVSFGVTMFTIGGRVNVASVMDTGADDKPQMLCDEYSNVFDDLERQVLGKKGAQIVGSNVKLDDATVGGI